MLSARRALDRRARPAGAHEDAFRQELIPRRIFVPLAFWVGANGFERALLIAACCCAHRRAAEFAIEATVDRISFENTTSRTRQGHPAARP